MARLTKKEQSRAHRCFFSTYIQVFTPTLHLRCVYTFIIPTPPLSSKKFLCTSLGKRRVTCLFHPQNHQHFFVSCLVFLFLLLCAGRFSKSALRSLWSVGGVPVAFFGGVFWCGLWYFFFAERTKTSLSKVSYLLQHLFGKHGNLKLQRLHAYMGAMSMDCTFISRRVRKRGNGMERRMDGWILGS